MMKQVVCGVIRNKMDEILLARRAEGEHLQGHWELPGGKVEAGESLAAALKRELAEELNLQAEIGVELARSVYHYAKGSIELVALEAESCTESLRLHVHDQVFWANALNWQDLELAPADIPLLETLFAPVPHD